MPDLTVYHLQPRSAFHLGQRGVGQEETGVHLPADTLFGALVTTYVEGGGQAAELAEPFLADAPFLLTSAFPRAGRVRFYPSLPLNLLRLSGDKIEQRFKELRAIQFVSEGIFQKILAGERLDDWLPAKEESEITPGAAGLYLQGRSLWLTAAEVAGLPETMRLKGELDRQYRALRHARLWHVGKTPRVTVDRQRNSANIFYTGRLSFSPGCGWWFGLAWRRAEPDLAHKLNRTLALLADTGMGGERAQGYGHFSYQEVDPITWLDDPAPGQPFVTLSRYHPRPAELPAALEGDPVAYRLVPVSGWLNSPGSQGQAKAQRRRRLWLLAEGSVVRAVGPGPWGDLTDLRPAYGEPASPFPHPVWRYGLACPAALKAGAGVEALGEEPAKASTPAAPDATIGPQQEEAHGL